jgi:hypothetical protein
VSMTLIALNVSDLPNRFSKNIYVEPNTGCWLWMGWVNDSGYGLIDLHRTSDSHEVVRVHREIFRIATGQSPGEIHHRCLTRSCCRPYHLVPTESTSEHRKYHLKKTCKNGHDLSVHGSKNPKQKRVCVTCRNAWRRRQRIIGHAERA